MEEEEPVAIGASSQVSELERTVAALNEEVQSLRKELQESREMEIVGVVNEADPAATPPSAPPSATANKEEILEAIKASKA